MTTESEMAVNLELASSYRRERELASWAAQHWYTAQNALEIYARRMRQEADYCHQQGIRGAERAFRESAAKADEAAAALAQVMEPGDPE